MRRYKLSTIINARDLGGYPAGNSETRTGVFLRTAAPVSLSEGDIALLKSLDLTDVVDLRSDVEHTQQPNAFLSLPDVQVHKLPFLSDPAHMPKTSEEVPKSYWDIAHAPNMVRVMRVFLAAKGASLFHCSAGKDRTGTVAALLELLAGVDDDDIIADYILSQAYMRKQLEIFARDYPQFPMALIYPTIENIVGFLELFHESYPRVEDYFLKLGLTSDEIASLKAKLLV